MLPLIIITIIYTKIYYFLQVRSFNSPVRLFHISSVSVSIFYLPGAAPPEQVRILSDQNLIANYNLYKQSSETEAEENHSDPAFVFYFLLPQVTFSQVTLGRNNIFLSVGFHSVSAEFSMSLWLIFTRNLVREQGSINDLIIVSGGSRYDDDLVPCLPSGWSLLSLHQPCHLRPPEPQHTAGV